MAAITSSKSPILFPSDPSLGGKGAEDGCSIAVQGEDGEAVEDLLHRRQVRFRLRRKEGPQVLLHGG